MHRSNVHNLLALATDVLAQSEARQRAARRLQHAVHHLNETARETGFVAAQDTQKLRDHTRAIRDLDEVERTLLDEFDAAISQLR
jgi:tRNA(Ile2) C34 agmatinyltransferase TiaS